MEERDTKKPRILLVEDDLKLAALVKEYLESDQFEVDVETRGDTAANRILTDKHDLVILDVMLPGLDGFE
ncbi:MAG: response regulator, partial [Verrucomicrobiaceae bacterium]|nr:response regulator [Verrucomicrobiaceae bacterium]